MSLLKINERKLFERLIKLTRKKESKQNSYNQE